MSASDGLIAEFAGEGEELAAIREYLPRFGIGKPGPEIFATALAALGVDAADAVMVGNDRERDIEGARAAGIRALWIQHGGTAGLSDLSRLAANI